MKKINLKKVLVHKQNVIIAIVVAIIFSCLTIGFAAYDKLLSIDGQVEVLRAGTVEITNITLVESSNVINSVTPSFDIRNSNFNITFNGTDENYKAIYQIDITNNSMFDYVYSGNTIEKNITSTVLGDGAILNFEIEGINNGDVIQIGEAKSFRVIISISNTNQSATYTTSISNEFNFTNDNSGNLIASLSTNTADLTGNKEVNITIEVINTYSYDRDFYLSQSNSNIVLNNNQNPKYTIPANSTQSFTATLKQAEDAIFLTGTDSTSISISSNNIPDTSIGSVNLNVDIYVEPDTEIPTVGNATLTIDDPEGEMTARWDRIDSDGTSIVNYKILLYNSLNELVRESNTNNSNTSYKFTGITEESYYIIVYGEDEAGNTGSSYVLSATTSNGYATKSSTVKMRWVFTVEYNLSGMTSSGAPTANLNQAYTSTFTANTGYTLPSTITVTMNGTTLSNNNGYTYSSSSKTLTINKVNGNIVINGTASRNGCLVEGTKVLLADNTYKNIEDIKYNDLLKVYSYEEGKTVNNYPIWIEKKHIANSYQKTTFSDGTILKTVGFHGVYDISKKEFISVDDEEKFKVGTKVAILDNDNNLKSVEVTSIEIINEKIPYYHVVSTRYYNIIANNIITTDGTTILSNLYGFNDNIMWPFTRNIILSNPNNLYKYEEFNEIMPYYMFKGLRVEEAKVLNNFGLTKEVFKFYLQGNQLSEEMLLKPEIDGNNNRKWMVTTSDNSVVNKEDYLVNEGNYYEVKEPIIKKDFIGWYNSSDGKYYQPFDKIQIWYGTYLEARYKK